ncbi:hypothetical protein K8R33_00805 [archaeon]|nr:hypothetical protein [archaeon]
MFKHYGDPKEACDTYVEYAEDIERLGLTEPAIELSKKYESSRDLGIALDTLVTLGARATGFRRDIPGEMGLAVEKSFGNVIREGGEGDSGYTSLAFVCLEDRE